MHTRIISGKIKPSLLLLFFSGMIMGLNFGCESFGHVVWEIENESKELLEFSIDLKSQTSSSMIPLIEKDTILPKGFVSFATFFGLGFYGFERDTVFGAQTRGDIKMQYFISAEDNKDRAYLLSRILPKLRKRKYPLVSIKWKNLTGTYADSITYPYYVLKREYPHIILPSGELMEYADEVDK